MKISRVIIVLLAYNSISACPICIDKLSENEIPFFLRESNNINEAASEPNKQSSADISKLQKVLVGATLFKGKQ